MTNLMIVGGMFVLQSFCMSSVMSTVSNAFDTSSAVMIVRLVFLVLKPVVIVFLMPRRADSVEWPFLKPC